MMSDLRTKRELLTIGGHSVERTACGRLRETCERVVHPSGLVILRLPKQMTQSYAMLVVRFGAQDTAFEVNGKQYKTPDGVAHFLEHKLFARPDGSDVNEHFSALGAEANAWTTYDKTAYLFSTAEDPGAALAVLLDFVYHPHFTPDNVAHERGIIREEIMMGEDDPWQRLYEQTMRAMYRDHPIRRRICGTVSSIEKITDEVLNECYRHFYRPDNMYLVVCGNIDMADVLSAVDVAMESRPADMALRRIERCSFDELPTVGMRRVSARANVTQPLFQIAVKDTVIPTDPYERLRRETAMNLLSEVLFSRASNFYNGLFERGLITPGYSYGYSTTLGAAYHALAGETDDPEAVWLAYLDTIERARREGLDREEVERYRRVLYASLVSEFDFPEDIADLICESEGNGVGVFDSLRAIDEITYEEVCALLRDGFDELSTTLSILYPQEDNKDKEDL